MIARHKTNTERRVPTDSIRRTKYIQIYSNIRKINVHQIL